MNSDKQTLSQWYAAFRRLAQDYNWPVSDDPDEYIDAWKDGTTPAEYLSTEFSYAEDDDT